MNRRAILTITLAGLSLLACASLARLSAATGPVGITVTVNVKAGDQLGDIFTVKAEIAS
jgi:hypothetical protein